MSKALYRKYRSKSLAEIIGQEHITTTLHNALQKGAISHAYLFTGPRGVGKTSIARILAHEVNGLPYEEDQNHLDVIEIDAASNRRIDEIRDLRERVHSAPTSAKYKVYIIDEVHMLTKEAFNALLKTLEEPPAHVIFILATTESHKLPDTIVSRTQRFSFKPIEPEQVIDHLRHISELENVMIDDEALALIAMHGGGSFRDSISLLDQARNVSDHVTADQVRQILGIAPAEAVEAIWQGIEQSSTESVIQLLGDLRRQGYQSGQLARQLAARLRQELIANRGAITHGRLLSTLKDLLDVPVSHDADTALELVLLSLILQDAAPTGSCNPTAPPPGNISPYTPAKPAQPIDKHPGASPDSPKSGSTTPEAAVEEVVVATTPTSSPQPVIATSTELNLDAWQTALTALKQHHNTLYSVARMAEPEFGDTTVTLHFNFAFHQKRVSETRNKQIIMDVIREACGQEVTINCVTTPKAQAPAIEPEQKPAAPANTPLDTISNIFGGGEVLDS